MSWNRRSLRVRVTAFGMLTLLVVLSVGAFVTVRALSSALQSDLDAQNAEVLDRLAEAIEGGADPTALTLPVGSDGTEFAIFDDEGGLLNWSLVPFDLDDLVITEIEGSLVVETAESLGDVVIVGETGVLDVSELAVDDGPLPVEATPLAVFGSEEWFRTSRTVDTTEGDTVRLEAFTPYGLVDRSVDRLGWVMIVVVPLVTLLGGVALWRSVGAALRPIGRISDEARLIAPSSSGQRLPVPDSGDEVADLTVTLNDMLDRLDAGLVRQRQFVSDASHELRSPLTVMRGSVELLADRDLDEPVRSGVDRVGRGVDRLEAVLDDLTELASTGASGAFESVDLAALVSSAVADRVSGAPDGDPAEPHLEYAPPEAGAGWIVVGREMQLRRALDNVLDNALRHASSTVVVSLRTAGGVVEVIVDDDGPGVDKADRARIFERFVRLDDGRSRDAGGSGLGLALVSSIMDHHGGSARCETSPSGGARLVLRMPRRAPD